MKNPSWRTRVVYIMLLLAGQTSALSAACFKQQEEVKYRLLWTRQDTFTSWIYYNVAVDGFPSDQELLEVVCDLLDRERPEGFQMVNIRFFHSIVGSKQIMDDELGQKQFATYGWNEKLLRNGKIGNLLVYMDPEGREYKFEKRPNIPFDYRTDCQRSDEP